jgi:hypothetical protein
VASGQMREPADWEWREAEYERRRQRARVVARRRGRLRLAAVVVAAAAVVGSALLAARAVSLPVPHSRAEPVPMIRDTTHAAVLPASGDDEEAPAEPGRGEATRPSHRASVGSARTARRPLLAGDRRNARAVPYSQPLPAPGLDCAALQCPKASRQHLGSRAVR